MGVGRSMRDAVRAARDSEGRITHYVIVFYQAER